MARLDPLQPDPRAAARPSVAVSGHHTRGACRDEKEVDGAILDAYEAGETPGLGFRRETTLTPSDGRARGSEAPEADACLRLGSRGPGRARG